MSNDTYIAAAYGLTWVVIVVYTVLLARRVSRAERAAEVAERGGQP